jgi:hypothetical protein
VSTVAYLANRGHDDGQYGGSPPYWPATLEDEEVGPDAALAPPPLITPSLGP